RESRKARDRRLERNVTRNRCICFAFKSDGPILAGESGEVTHSYEEPGSAESLLRKNGPKLTDGGILGFGIHLQSASSPARNRPPFVVEPRDFMKSVPESLQKEQNCRRKGESIAEIS